MITYDYDNNGKIRLTRRSGEEPTCPGCKHNNAMLIEHLGYGHLGYGRLGYGRLAAGLEGFGPRFLSEEPTCPGCGHNNALCEQWRVCRDCGLSIPEGCCVVTVSD